MFIIPLMVGDCVWCALFKNSLEKSLLFTHVGLFTMNNNISNIYNAIILRSMINFKLILEK